MKLNNPNRGKDNYYCLNYIFLKSFLFANLNSKVRYFGIVSEKPISLLLFSTLSFVLLWFYFQKIHLTFLYFNSSVQYRNTHYMNKKDVSKYIVLTLILSILILLRHFLASSFKISLTRKKSDKTFGESKAFSRLTSSDTQKSRIIKTY